MRAVVFLVLLAASTLPANVSGAQPTDDRAAARQISSHLQQSGQLRNYRVGVTYKDGIATLSGSVANVEQRDTAIRLAQQVPGVKRINCQLECPQQKAIIGTGPRELATAFEKGKPIVAQAGAQRPTMLARNNPAARRPQPMRRNNMPLPAPSRYARDQHIRQASAMGVQHAGGPCCDGYGGAMGPGAMGPGAMGPGAMGPGAMGPGMEMGAGGMAGAQAMPAGFVPSAYGRGPSYENAQMPGYAWPSYASYPNYAALSYPQQYSPTAWPYIGPFYPYPQVPLAWRKVSLEWDDGWWFLDFSAHNSSH